ncbi:MAG: delta-60 repeat domain-containing protein [Flavobacteriales bacterium]
MRTLSTAVLLCAASLLQAQTYTLSPTFGTNGALHVPFVTGDHHSNAHAITADGKLLVAGGGYDGTTNSYHVTMMRLDTVCGALDTTFGEGGVAVRVLQGRTICNNIALQPDGKIVGCGLVAPDNSGSQQTAGVYRFNADGSVDTTFNGTGYHRLYAFGSVGDFERVFVNADGTITCVGGAWNTGLGAVRFTAEGTLDSTYGVNGTAMLPYPLPPAYSVDGVGGGLVRPDGSVLAIRQLYGSNFFPGQLILAQFDPTGAPDQSFGVGGITNSGFTCGSVIGTGMALLPDGRFLVSGSGPGQNGFMMVRFLANGTVDSTYATNGVSLVYNTGVNHGYDLELFPDGSTLQYGDYDSKGQVLKRDADGQVVTTFGSAGDGFVYAGPLANDAFLGGFTLPSGRIMAYGGRPQNVLVAKLTTDLVADGLPVITLSGSDLITTGSGDLQWYLDGVLINGATANTFSPTTNGAYTVTMEVSGDCMFTSAPYDLLNVGVEELSNGSMHVFNNGSGSVVVVNDGAVAPYELLDLSGKRIVSGTLRTGRNDMGLGIAPGVYLLRTLMGTQRIVVY